MTPREPGAAAKVKVGDRVRVWIGPKKQGGWEHGTVTEVDSAFWPGVRVKFDRHPNGVDNCYATHAEVEHIPTGSAR